VTVADLTPERLQELRRIASAATPGPWEWDKYLHLFSATGTPVLTKPFSPDNPDVVEARPEDLDYIERFNPETALALLDLIEALERRNSEIAQLIIDAITWFYDEDTGSVTVTDDDPRGGLERLRQALLMLDPAAAARFPQFWRW